VQLITYLTQSTGMKEIEQMKKAGVSSPRSLPSLSHSSQVIHQQAPP
jgi:hypothetical protein